MKSFSPEERRKVPIEIKFLKNSHGRPLLEKENS